MNRWVDCKRCLGLGKARELPPYTTKKVKKLVPKGFPMPSNKDLAEVVRACTFVSKGKNSKKPYVEFIGKVVVLSEHSYNAMLDAYGKAHDAFRRQAVEGLITSGKRSKKK